MHPLFELLLNPFAGAAGFNLIAIMFYIGLALIVGIEILVKSFHE